MLITPENAMCFHVRVDEANPDNILKVWKDLRPIFWKFKVEQKTTLLCQLLLDLCLRKYP